MHSNSTQREENLKGSRKKRQCTQRQEKGNSIRSTINVAVSFHTLIHLFLLINMTNCSVVQGWHLQTRIHLRGSLGETPAQSGGVLVCFLNITKMGPPQDFLQHVKPHFYLGNFSSTSLITSQYPSASHSTTIPLQPRKKYIGVFM